MPKQVPVWMRDVTRIAVLSGAGISTGSGIPDYRGPDGVWTRDPAAAAAFTLDTYLRDPDVRARFWRTYVDHPAWQAQPNAAHQALARLDESGIAVRVLTQNIDGLHQRAGLADRKVLELHGTMWTTTCTRCRSTVPTTAIRARVATGEHDPHCTGCGGPLKLDTVLFGQNLNPDIMRQAVAIVSNTPLLLAIGSSLLVEPAAQLCRVAVERGAHLVVINRDPTPYDHLAIEVIRTDITHAVTDLVDQLIAAGARVRGADDTRRKMPA
ncbi:SIR2 family NAD-dependent protein deacylase [Rugosimonospora africana]|nr:Sir2 family NAD-dependent protein deacetylase [Rugosimonospora africana]